jgi:MoxR-like ATPase
LLEGAPGLAKTTLVKSLSQTLGLDFGRIQFTPDLLPADIMGTLIYNPKNQEFITRKGPIFTNLLLADEINRAPAKVQSALLEAMQEHQVTIGETTHFLDRPFLVLATQNPIEQEGTYRLPEAQVDRFMLKLLIKHPKFEEEKEIIQKVLKPEKLNKIISKKDFNVSKDLVDSIYIDQRVIDYLVSIVFATRDPQNYNLGELEPLIEHGVSPRGSIMLHRAARANAFLKKRHFVLPDDIKAVVYDILRHRILLSYEAEAENITSDIIIQKILQTIPAP